MDYFRRVDKYIKIPAPYHRASFTVAEYFDNLTLTLIVCHHRKDPEADGLINPKTRNMSSDKLFGLCSNLALLSWVILIFFVFWKDRDKYLVGIVILLFAIIYSWLIFSNFDPGIFRDFETLDGITHLFSSKPVLLAGWVHYLAFDLLAGVYIFRNAKETGINHWITTPALLCTFMFGPFGLLLYFIMRWIKTKQFLRN